MFYVFFCIFDSFRLKNKGHELSACGPAHAGSCQCGPEIKFLDCDMTAAHVANNGPGRASSGLASGRAQIVSVRVARVLARPMHTSTCKLVEMNKVKLKLIREIN